MNNNSIIVNRHLYVDTIKSLPQAELANYNGLRAGFLNGVPVWEGPANIALPMAVGFDGKTSGDTNLFCGSMGGGIGRNSKLYSPEALGFERSDSWKDLPHQGLYVHTFASTPCLNLTNDIKVGHTQNVFCRLAVSLSGSAAPLIKLADMKSARCTKQV